MTFEQIVWLFIVGSLSIGALFGYIKHGLFGDAILAGVFTVLGAALILLFAAFTYQIWSV